MSSTPEGFGGFGGPHPQANTDCGNCHLGVDGSPDLTGIHGNDCASCHPDGFATTILGPIEPGMKSAATATTRSSSRPATWTSRPRGIAAWLVTDISSRSTTSRRFTRIMRKLPTAWSATASSPIWGSRSGRVIDRVVPIAIEAVGRQRQKIHKKHVDKGLSCLECHDGMPPPVDVVEGPPVGGASNICEICHRNESPGEFRDDSEDLHERHTKEMLDCGSCHAQANLQDDRDPMPTLDDPVRALLNRQGNNECRHCHRRGEDGSSREVHEKHVASQWQWCYNCHEGDDPRPVGDAPPVTEPTEACRLCHSGESYRDTFPFDIHDRHAKEAKCYACHQTVPQLFDWPKAWLGGVD